MEKVQLWVLSGVVGFIAALALILIPILIKGWSNRQSDLATAINELRLVLVKQGEQLKTLFDHHVDFNTDLKEVEKRVAKLEVRQISCINYKNRKNEKD